MWHRHSCLCFSRSRIRTAETGGQRISSKTPNGGVVIVRLCILALFAAWLNAQDPAHSDVNFYSKEKEAALGASLASEVRNRTAAISDSTVHDYIERLGRQLAVQLRGDLDWEFAVIRDDKGGSTHELLSFPGGHIFVPASLILAAENEAELAGMLAHSMAHIAERRMAGRGRVGNSSTIPLIFMGSSMGNDDRVLVPVGFLKIQRDYELDADRVAVNIMAAAWFDPLALLEYIRRTQPARTAKSGRYSVLPPRDERISALEAVIASLPSRTGRPGDEFKAIRDSVRELTAYH
jgi:predicted Zn-dependent protease